MTRLFLLFTLLFLVGCSAAKKIGEDTAPKKISSLRFINDYVLPGGQVFQGTIVGGLSGIDYDIKRDLYYINSDDPSSKGPSRYYTTKVFLKDGRLDSVAVVAVTILLNEQGQPFPDINKDRLHSADVEAIRYDSKRDELLWSSEGQRHLKNGQLEIEQPVLKMMSRDGMFKDSFFLPGNIKISNDERGLRHNGVFEGVAFNDDQSEVFVSIEEPLYEDGPRAGGSDSSAWTRILRFDRLTMKATAQYAYQIDPVPFPAIPSSAFKVNGVSDILHIGNDQLLIVERAYSTGRIQSDIRFYIADYRDAEDISNKSLMTTPTRKPMIKKLIVDLSSLGIFTDNIEGVCFGPRLPNGHSTLICVTDDNFDKRQKTQFLLFEILP